METLIQKTQKGPQIWLSFTFLSRHHVEVEM